MKGISSLSKVEKLSLSNFLKDAQKKAIEEKQRETEWKDKIMQQEARELMEKRKKDEESRQLQEYLKAQIEERSGKSKDGNIATKSEFNQRLSVLPENQVCMFPKILEDTPEKQIKQKLEKQKINANNLKEQLLKKGKNREIEEKEIIKERELADKIKESFDKETANKKQIETQKRAAYGKELISTIQKKAENTENDMENEDEDEENGSDTVEKLDIINKYFEGTEQPLPTNLPIEQNLNEHAIQSKTIEDEAIHKEDVKISNINTNDQAKTDKRSESVSVNSSAYVEKLTKKIEEYQERMRKRGKQIYSIDVLKKLAMTAGDNTLSEYISSKHKSHGYLNK